MKIALHKVQSLWSMPVQACCVYGATRWFVSDVARGIAEKKSGEDTFLELSAQSAYERFALGQENRVGLFGQEAPLEAKVALITNPLNLKLPQIKEILSAQKDVFLVLEVPEYLRPSSGLRKFFEKENDLWSLALYEPTAQHRLGYLKKACDRYGIKASAAALQTLQSYMQYNSDNIENMLKVCDLFHRGEELSDQGVRLCLSNSYNVLDVVRLVQAFVSKNTKEFSEILSCLNWEDVPQLLLMTSLMQEVVFLMVLMKKKFVSSSDPLLFKWKTAQSHVNKWSEQDLFTALQWGACGETLSKKKLLYGRVSDLYSLLIK